MRRRDEEKSSPAIVLFPTPPLAEDTMTTFPTPLIGVRSGRRRCRRGGVPAFGRPWLCELCAVLETRQRAIRAEKHILRDSHAGAWIDNESMTGRHRTSESTSRNRLSDKVVWKTLRPSWRWTLFCSRERHIFAVVRRRYDVIIRRITGQKSAAAVLPQKVGGAALAPQNLE